VEWLEQRGVRRGTSISIVFTVLFVSAVLIFALTIPELVNQMKRLIGMEPGAARAIGGVVSQIQAHGEPRGHGCATCSMMRLSSLTPRLC